MQKKFTRTIFLTTAFLFSLTSAAMSGEVEKRIEKPVRQAIDTRQATQKAQAKWREDRDRLTARFEQLEAENANLTQVVAKLNAQS
jgi:FtsZ-binding cell division protein ZapB